MTKRITIHVGEGTGIDGACFFAFEVDGAGDDDDETVVGTHDDEGGAETFSIDDIERYLTEEIESNEPISITSVPEDVAVGSIRLPLRSYMDVAVHSSEYEVYEAEELREDRDLFYHVQDRLAEHGGGYQARY